VFKKIRHQLLFSYLAILITILGIFSAAVRVILTHTLSQGTEEKLTALAQGAAANLELEEGNVQIRSDFNVQDLVDHDQGLEWFDIQGNVINKQGKYILNQKC
jgi:OmpR-family two-component system manganese-sensing sensor histidine kinase